MAPWTRQAALRRSSRLRARFGEALKKGHRPRRTVVFAVWDGEEPLLGSSTQWAMDNAEALRKDAITYINVDSGVQGGDFVGGATPALADFLRGVTRDVQDPVTGKPLYDAWASRFKEPEPRVESIVGATDYTAFQEYLGISCIDMYFDGPYGVYHSQYDNYFRQSTVVDPGFDIGVGLSRLWGTLAWRLAEVPVLPMRYSDYAQAAAGYIDAVETSRGQRKADQAGRRASGRHSLGCRGDESGESSRGGSGTARDGAGGQRTADAGRARAGGSRRECTVGHSSAICWWRRSRAIAARICRASGMRSIAMTVPPFRRMRRRSWRLSIARRKSCAKRLPWSTPAAKRRIQHESGMPQVQNSSRCSMRSMSRLFSSSASM